jgi:hypothetical protein
VKAGDIGARFEYGTGVNLRRLYGTYNFGAGTIKIGQDHTPMDLFVSDQCGLGGGDCGLIGWGTMYTGRQPQLGLSMGGFSVALRKPAVTQILTAQTTSIVSLPAGSTAPTGGTLLGTAGGLDNYSVTAGDFAKIDTDTTMPTIEAGYSFSFGPAAIMLAGGYSSYDVAGISGTTEKEYSVDSWAVGLAFKLGFGPLYVNGSVYTGENPEGLGLAQDITIEGADYNSTTDAIEDTETLVYVLVLGFNVSDMIKLEAGYGAIQNERDLGAVTSEVETNAWYIQAALNPVKNVFIIPEIGVVDYNELEKTGAADKELGDVTYFGVKWQINW